jgi:hypothetical protein
MSVEIKWKMRFWMMTGVKGFMRHGLRKKVFLTPFNMCRNAGEEVGDA